MDTFKLFLEDDGPKRLSREEIDRWMVEYLPGIMYRMNGDGRIDVDGDVDLFFV